MGQREEHDHDRAERWRNGLKQYQKESECKTVHINQCWTSSTHSSGRETSPQDPHKYGQPSTMNRSKKEVMKGQNEQMDLHVWLASDLTQYRAKLAYLAHALVKEGHVSQTWTFDSKVFVRVKPGDRQKRVYRPEDILGLEIA